MQKIKFAILGAGKISRKMGKTIMEMEGIEPYAVASRDIVKAQDFGEEFGFSKAYGSYEELVQDQEIDLVYIATPISHHYEHMKLCLLHGKHVLCEKAFTTNAQEARELVEIAKDKSLLLAEAIWTRYMPSAVKLREMIADGVIGRPYGLTANLAYIINKVPRLVDPALGGGALLDVGVYPVNFASMAFGTDIERIEASATLTETGVDEQISITVIYRDGKMAQLFSSMMVQSDRRGIIYGDQGTIVVENINNCEEIAVYDLKRERILSYQPPEQITGFEYQVKACMKAIHEGRSECPEMPHTEIIRMMEIMDEARVKCGVSYPHE